MVSFALTHAMSVRHVAAKKGVSIPFWQWLAFFHLWSV